MPNLIRKVNRLRIPSGTALRQRGLPMMVEVIQDYAILLLDPLGCVASWNQGAERTKGYRAEEILGRHFRCFYPPEEAAAGVPEATLARAAAEGRHELEGWRVRKDGSRFYANVVVTAVRERGELLGFVKVTRDITDRQALLESLRRHQEELEALVVERSRELEAERRTLQLIYDAHADPMVLLRVEPEGHRVVSVNRVCAQALGREPGDLVGTFLDPLIRTPTHEVFEAFRKATTTGEPQRLERRTSHLAEPRVYDAEVIPLPQGAP